MGNIRENILGFYQVQIRLTQQDYPLKYTTQQFHNIILFPQSKKSHTVLSGLSALHSSIP